MKKYAALRTQRFSENRTAGSPLLQLEAWEMENLLESENKLLQKNYEQIQGHMKTQGQ